MQPLNVLFIGDKNSSALKFLSGSKYLNKFYTNFESENVVCIKFNTFKELAVKCRSLKIDVVFVEDEKFVFQGIADVLRTNYVNCIALTSNWSKLVLSESYARKMLDKYEILAPKILSYPSIYPLMVKTDGFCQKANSLAEVLQVKEFVSQNLPQVEDRVHLEEFLVGNEYILNSFFDGKNLITYNSDLPSHLVNSYNNQLKNMFIQEKANFIGYINSRVIYSNGMLYNIGFNINFPNFGQDILYLTISAIYQKLDEVNLNSK